MPSTTTNHLIIFFDARNDQVCKKCDRPWGSEADGCYEKPHNIRLLKTPKDQDSTMHAEPSSEEEKIDYDKSYG